MKKNLLALTFCVIVLLTSPNNVWGQGGNQQCTEWEGEFPCNLLTYLTLVDPATLPIAHVAVSIHIVRYTDSSGGFTGDLAVNECERHTLGVG